jgi:dihydroorotate dehydrogenase electron transfer subunit
MCPITPNQDYRLNKPFMTPILEIIEENPRVKSYRVKYNPIDAPIDIRPGQFVMVWVPPSDEIPMSISKIGLNCELTISVAKVGPTTEFLHKFKVGDLIGIRGPYGNFYRPNPGIAIIIGGGIGMASVRPLIHNLVDSQKQKVSPTKQIICISGAKKEDELLYSEELEKLLGSNCSLEICTDDGSCGFKGFTTEKLDQILKEYLEDRQKCAPNTEITVYACGPEKMLARVYQICKDKHVKLQVSLERMMRCGFGICGLCALDEPGLLVCRDGPIFTDDQLENVHDFGKIHRDFSGKPHNI